MLRVLLVDDEPLVHIGIKSLWKWEEEGILFNWEAENGKTAWEIIQEGHGIDLILTDISMPVLDGLELIDLVNSNFPGIPVIVLSSYYEYDLVREAFRKGAVDYILKSEMEPIQILDVIRKNLGDLLLRSPSTEAGYRGFLSPKEHLLNGLIDSNSGYDVKKSRLLLEELGLIGNKTVLFCIQIDDFDKIREKHNMDKDNSFNKGLVSCFSKVLKKYRNCEILSLSVSSYIVFLNLRENDSSSLKRVVKSICSSICHLASMYMNVSLSAGISPAGNLRSEGTLLYGNAKTAVLNRFYYGKGRVFHWDDYSFSGGNGASESLRTGLNGIFSLLKENRIPEVRSAMEEVRGAVMNNLPPLHPDLFRSIVFEFHTLLVSHLRNSEINRQILDAAVSRADKIKQAESYQSVLDFLSESVDSVISCRCERENKILSQPVVKARKVIDLRFHDPNLNLDSVSRELQFSSGYLSHLFSREMGISFSRYLNKVRISRAENLLLTTNKKLYEIAEEVGYFSLEHFSRTFKKQTGVSPKKYAGTGVDFFI